MNSISKTLILALFLSLLPPLSAYAETMGRITVEQKTPILGMYGRWDMVGSSSTELAGHKSYDALGAQPTGSYTIFIDPPEGATSHVTVYNGTNELVSTDTPQASFEVTENSNIHIEIEHIFTRVGNVAVTSNLDGLRFEIRGPNNFKRNGETPESFEKMPEGQYSATFEEIPHCLSAPTVSDKLVKDSRITLSINVDCEQLPERFTDQDKPSITHVSVSIDGETVIYSDLPLEAWYAPWTNAVIRNGVMRGDSHRNGNLKGIFRPGDNVSIAELSKIAHSISSRSVENVRWEPKNERARGAWFSKYFASAEEKGWLVFQDQRLDPSRSATRAEVIATFLQAMNVQRDWATGKMFGDVTVDTKYSASIETAATDEVIAGYTSPDGSATGNFGPENPITRAEIAKIIKLSIDSYIEDTANIFTDSY